MLAAQVSDCFKITTAKVTGGQGAHLVDCCHDRGRPIQVLRPFCAQFWIVDQVSVHKCGLHYERVLHRQMGLDLPLRLIDHNGFQSLTAHHCAQTAPGCMVAALIMFSGGGDTCASHQEFAGLPD